MKGENFYKSLKSFTLESIFIKLVFPYGGKLWRMITLVNLPKNHFIANFQSPMFYQMLSTFEC